MPQQLPMYLLLIFASSLLTEASLLVIYGKGKKKKKINKLELSCAKLRSSYVVLT
jgi:hypothetical protein